MAKFIILIALILLFWPSTCRQVLISIDQLINARLGGYPDETFSARCWRCRSTPKYKRLVAIINAIFFWQDNHCLQSHISEVKRRHLPRMYRN